MSYQSFKRRTCDDVPAEYFRNIIAPTIPQLPADHPRRLYERDFFGVWTNKLTGERLLPDQFARLEMEFERRRVQLC